MTYAQFRNAVCGFANRTDADLTKNGVDMIAIAANMAKIEAQRRKVFKMSRGSGFIAASDQGTDLITSLFTTPGGTTVLKLRKIEQVWLFATSGALYTRARRIEVINPVDLKMYYPVGNAGELNPQVAFQDASTLKAYVRGTKLYVLGLNGNTTTTVMVDAFVWLDDYTGINTDFFLTYHSDWLVAKTVDYLNIFLKEDQRVAIAQNKLETAFTSVCSFDDEFAEGSEDAGLLE